MKHLVLSLALLLVIRFAAEAQVGIGTTTPSTTLHLYKDTDYPVLRLEGTSSNPDQKSSRVEWVYHDGEAGKGYSVSVVDGEFRINRLSEGSLATVDYPALRLDPEHIAVNVENESNQVTANVSLSVNGSIAAGNRTINADYAMPVNGDTEDYVILADATGENITVTLCSAAGQKGRLLVVKKIAGGNVVFVDGYSSEKIDGNFIYGLSSQYQFISLQSDGSNWFIIGNN
jgi:hypothetical protein